MMSTKPSIAPILVGVICYALILGPFVSYMSKKPIEEKLGYVPSLKVIRAMSADQKELTAASLVMKVLMYFGGLVPKEPRTTMKTESPDLLGMSRLLHGAVQLDPYNVDAYYFAQSFLTWDAKQFKIANELLDYGMKYRTWDWYLPFFAGFNSAYFLKDYPKAATYYKRAGELSGQDLHKSLASRYMQESGRTDLAIAYLTVIEKGERNQSIKKDYQIRLAAFYEVKRIEIARDRFMAEHGGLPISVEQLVQLGLLAPAPADPYGGRFYLEPSGKVATTSKFAFATKNK